MPASLEKRISALERKIAELQRHQEKKGPAGREWVDDLYGAFKDDPIFAQAMTLGRNYRRSLRPQVRNAKSTR